MFEFIRSHQRLMQFLLLLIILPAFAIGFGLQGYSGLVDDPTALAKVCGNNITQQEFTRAQQEQLDTLRQQLRGNFRPEMFDSPEMRLAVLDGLVNQRVLTCGAVRRNVVVSDERVRQTILALPSLQANGQFSKELYALLLQSQGMTGPMFDDRVRQSLSTQVFNAGLVDSAFAPQVVQDLMARAQEEQREVQDLIIKPDAYVAQVKIAPDAVKAYYDANQRDFQVPSQVKVEYAVLSTDAIAATLQANAEEVKTSYEQNQARYGDPEQRQASHILIKADDEKDKPAAKAKAEDVLKQVKAPGADFAALAKKYSQDPGSAVNGGDLGMFARGAMVKPFEDAAFGLKEGEVSGLVESQFGYHIIKLTAIKPAKVKPFEEVRAGLEQEWKKQRAQKQYTESAEGFTNTVYEQADSLKPAADKYKLPIQTSQFFSRVNAPKELGNPKLLDRLFGDDAIKSKRNTEAVETAPGMLVSARVLEYKPQSVQPLAEATPRIVALLTQKEAQTMAKKEGEAKLKAAQAAGDAVAFGAAKTVSRTKPESIAPEALKSVMGASPAKLPAVVGVELADGGYGVYRVVKVSQPDKPDPAAREALKRGLARVQSEGDFTAYLAGLKAAAKVELHADRLEKKQN